MLTSAAQLLGHNDETYRRHRELMGRPVVETKPAPLDGIAFCSMNRYDLTLTMSRWDASTPDSAVVLYCNDGRTATCGELRQAMRDAGMNPDGFVLPADTLDDDDWWGDTDE